MKAYKGFDKNMMCRGFKFEEGNTYEEKEAIICKKGFHACTNPVDIFTYYSPVESVYHEVELDEVSEKSGGDSKVCGKKIKIGTKLDLEKIIQTSVKIDIESSKIALKESATSGDCSPAATSGDNSPAATSGDYSHVATSGDYSPAATSGYNSPAATSGDSSHAATSGYNSPAATSGYNSPAATSGYNSPAATSGDYSPAATSGCNSPAATSGYNSHVATSGYNSPAATSGIRSIAAAIGKDSTAKASVGSWIVLAEYGDWDGKAYPVLCVKAGKIDGENLKPDTWYRLENGDFVACNK